MAQKKEKTLSIGEMIDFAVDELEAFVHKPNILAYKPYSDQESFHRSPKPGRYVAGGNRAGKSDAEVVEAIWIANDMHPYRERPAHWGHGPVQLRFVVVDIAKGVEQIILPKLKRWVPRSMLVDGDWFKSWDSKNMIFTFENGSTIDFLTHGMTLDKHGGVPRHAIFFDEEPPQDIFNENLMRLVDYDGWWVIAATPVQGMGWTYDLLWEPALDGSDPNVSCHHLDPRNNPYLKADKDQRGRFFVGMSKEEREIREEGKFVAKSGLVFKDFSKPTHVLPEPVDMNLIRNWTWYTSTDFGYNNPTAWLWTAVGPLGQMVTFSEHYQREMTIPEHAAIVNAREQSWGRRPEIRTGDPAGNQRMQNTGMSAIQEYARYGLFIGTESIPRDEMIGIEKMQQYFRVFPAESPWGPNRPFWVFSPNCPNLISELGKLRWKTYESSKMAYNQNKKEEVHDKDNHGFDAAKYLATMMPDLKPVRDLTMPPKDLNANTVSMTEIILEQHRRAEEADLAQARNGIVRWDTEDLEDYEEHLIA